MNKIKKQFAQNVLIQNAYVIDPSNNLDGVMDVLIREGEVVKIEKKISDNDALKINAKGFHLIPGLIDMHVHLRDPGYEQKETFETGIRAAVYGGFVGCVTMPNTNPPCDNAQIVKYQIERGDQSDFSIFPAGTLTHAGEGKKVSEMAEMKSAGAIAVTDDGYWLHDSGVARRAYEYAATYGLIVMTHAEDKKLSLNGVINESIVSTKLGLRGKPNASEDIATARDIELARLTGCNLHIMHVSTKKSVEMIRKAKTEGLKVTGEATPHHISLTDEALVNYDTNFKMNPPLRREEDRLAVIEGLKNGTLDVISTDHAPHAAEEKDKDFEESPNGVIGLESAFGIIMTELYHGRKWKMADIVRIMSLNPSEIIGESQLGRLKQGELANFILVDPDFKWTFNSEEIKSKSANTCFLGKKLKGKVFHTFANGYHYDLGVKK